MYNAKLLAQRLLLSRRDLSWRQEDLESKSGVSRTYISEIERGRITNVGVEVVFSLAEALGVSVPYLLGITDDVLGEGSEKVSLEQSRDYVLIDIDDPEERRQVQQVFDEIVALSPKSRRIAINMIHSMRQIEEEENAPLVPRIVE
jgi:transcriptional regulator with XRE-family HTH domain